MSGLWRYFVGICLRRLLLVPLRLCRGNAPAVGAGVLAVLDLRGLELRHGGGCFLLGLGGCFLLGLGGCRSGLALLIRHDLEILFGPVSRLLGVQTHVVHHLLFGGELHLGGGGGFLCRILHRLIRPGLPFEVFHGRAGVGLQILARQFIAHITRRRVADSKLTHEVGVHVPFGSDTRVLHAGTRIGRVVHPVCLECGSAPPAGLCHHRVHIRSFWGFGCRSTVGCCRNGRFRLLLVLVGELLIVDFPLLHGPLLAAFGGLPAADDPHGADGLGRAPDAHECRHPVQHLPVMVAGHVEHLGVPARALTQIRALPADRDAGYLYVLGAPL